MSRKTYLGWGKFYYLLLFLLLFFLSYPILFEFEPGKLVSVIFFSFIFFSSIYAIGRNKRFFILAIILTVIAVGLKWVSYFHGIAFMVLSSDIVNIFCFAVIAGVILFDILKEKAVTFNDICGAICVYLLIGLAWAFAYSVIEYFNPGAIFIPGGHLDAYHKLPHLIYFSFITLTSTGFGDIHPVSLIAESFSSVEAIIGQVYLVVLIGWLVGGYISVARKKLK